MRPQGRSDREVVAGGNDELADDQVGGQFRVAVADALDPYLDHRGAAAALAA